MLLLEKVFDIINNSGLKYCIQNKYEMMPEEIPSDIDMMYMDASESFLDDLVKRIVSETELIITQKICQGYYEYTYILSYSCPKDYFQLQLDFYRAISRRGYLNIMPAEEMISTRRYYKVFYVPSTYIELKYMWIRRTIKHDLNDEHIQIAKGLYDQDPENNKEKLSKDYGEDITKLILKMLETGETKIFYDNYALFNKKAKGISRKNSSLVIRAKYMKFLVTTVIPKRIFHKCGISVAFLSPDGGGKSTVIQSIKGTVSGSFYGVNIIYMRPHLFRNLGHYNVFSPAEEAESNTNPHGKTLDNPMKSFARFMFYNLDYLLGTIIKINKMKVGKQIVIFDRYYYDYYADMERYGYNLPSWMPKVFEWMIPQPDLIFILDGSAECLYTRKQELTIEELRQQRESYQGVAEKGDNFIQINVERSVQEIVDEITEIILSRTAERTRKIMQ